MVLPTKVQAKPNVVLTPEPAVVKNKAVKPENSNIASKAQLRPACCQIIKDRTAKAIKGSPNTKTESSIAAESSGDGTSAQKNTIVLRTLSMIFHLMCFLWISVNF
jgi:hypothetical protein